MPATVTGPLWVRAPLVVTPKVPETVEAPRSNALASRRLTLLPLVMPTVLKLFAALLRVMLLAAPAARVVTAGHGQDAALGEGAVRGHA